MSKLELKIKLFYENLKTYLKLVILKLNLNKKAADLNSALDFAKSHLTIFLRLESHSLLAHFNESEQERFRICKPFIIIDKNLHIFQYFCLGLYLLHMLHRYNREES